MHCHGDDPAYGDLPLVCLVAQSTGLSCPSPVLRDGEQRPRLCAGTTTFTPLPRGADEADGVVVLVVVLVGVATRCPLIWEA